MKTFPLFTSIKAGMTRLRTKGGASPEALFDLKDGYIDASRAMSNRPGTTHITDTLTGTKGFMPHQGKLWVFSHEPTVMANALFHCATLRHPTNDALTIAKIHFSAPYMNSPYVVAEYSNGDVYHFWLENLPEWEASTGYDIGNRVLPTVENGFHYEAGRLNAASPQWAPSVPRQVGDVVEPTVYNGFEYVVESVDGSNPASGTTEPVWPTVEDATVFEDTDGASFTFPTTPGDDGDGATTPDTDGDYSNPGGTTPGLGGNEQL